MTTAEIYMMKRFDEKLRELMTPEDYTAWSIDVAKGMFYAEIDESPESEFKDFVLKNWEKITDDFDNNNTGL